MSLVLLYCTVQSTLTTGRGVMSNSVRLGSFGILRLILCISLPLTSVAFAQNAAARPSVPWPTKGWTKGTPASVGLDEKVLLSFDDGLGSGKYMLIDSFHVFRCGEEVFAHTYAHDYGQIYGKEAKTKG